MKCSSEPDVIRVGIDPVLLPWAPEIKYVFRTLLRIAGHAWEFGWIDEQPAEPPFDIHYSPSRDSADAHIVIPASGKPFTSAPWQPPKTSSELGGITYLDFGERLASGGRGTKNQLKLPYDIVFASYWLLTGAGEHDYRRDSKDNYILEDAFIFEQALLSKPLVSIYGRLIRDHLQRLGYHALDPAWTSSGNRAAIVLTHDVDYPQAIRWIESLRLIRAQGLGAAGKVGRLIDGTSHFWKFADWVEFAKGLGTRPTFYFMARKGSLIRYGLGTPDGFYDVRSTEFRQLFSTLREARCEIGLHASYNAYRSVEQLGMEKQRLEEAAGIPVLGNRHHYWHLDPSEPHETLSKLERAGLMYDSSLGFDFYPGFRRGICHPFHPFHPGERRELQLLQLPPTWMDDHFDRRLSKNGIADPAYHARALCDEVQRVKGTIVLDYHIRGMNEEIYPRYGAWLREFFAGNKDLEVSFHTASELAQAHLAYEDKLNKLSRDLTVSRSQVHINGRGAIGSEPVCDPIVVSLLETDEERHWDEFAGKHGDIYHTLAWRSVTEEGFGHKPYYLKATDHTGRLSGILPLFLVKGIYGRRLVSMPMRDRGGIVSSHPSASSELIDRAIQLTRELDCKYLHLRSFDEMDPDLVSKSGLLPLWGWTTTRIDLTAGVDQLWQGLEKKSVRWAVKKASKVGVHVEVDNTLAGVERFHDMFTNVRCAMGIPPFPRALFVSIFHHLIRDGKANLFVAYKGAEPINAMVNLLSGNTFIPAYAAPQNRWRKFYPSEAMFWYAIKWAAERGFTHVDFGADSPRQVGLLFFKRKWGGVHRPLPNYYYLNGIDRPPNLDSSSPFYTLVRRIWTKLPITLCRGAGGLVTRQLS